jgi:SAM-dependent methyltransferase
LAKSQFHNVLAWGQEESHLQKIQRKFLNYFPKEGRVVDLGSGRGIFLDLLGEALDFLQKSSEKYDGIFASHVIEHMEIESGKALIEAMKSHLKPGGVMIIITPRPGSLWSSENFWLDTTHVRPYPFELMKRLVAPLEIVAGGIEPDSDPTKDYSQLAKIKLAVRKRLIGPELYDFTYGGGVSYIVAKLNG